MDVGTRDEWPMQEIVRITGATSRTLRHYQQVGLLLPSRTGHGGQRFYDRDGLLRLQRILVLRELGLGLPQISQVLEESVATATALREHAEQLERERERLARVAASVRATLSMIETGGELMTDTMFNGFDHTQYQEEVEQRWGAQAYADADRWWRSLSDADKLDFRAEIDALVAGYADASARELPVGGEEVQALTGRLHTWVGAGWGGTAPGADAFVGLGDMYVADPRFGATFFADGRAFATYVRDAMTVYALDHLE
ncbi:MerR family transcriptional regulator [Brachybacterium sacelli]|uniref:DNA-binding transcriptional MerR regulator n=1 Tax=Brachybacterium sacelli TaxID=173364 RepID=A0ABS4X555_9MICO|nr:MerR family transcriptional regulator [Brachybacterium sacelli]MBP2383378.1 DNA-binding transcriptional MerR regulator [Brachybacterium sacelli]